MNLSNFCKTYLGLKYEKPNDENDVWLIKRQNTLRKLIGILGVLLPLLLWFFLSVDTNFTFWEVLPSISHYYYTRVCGILIIVVSLLAIFLIVYKGSCPEEFIASSIAGIFALSLLLFPTDNLVYILNGTYESVNVTRLRISKFRETFHAISAGIFLVALMYLSFKVFPQETNRPTINKIFRICAVIMLLALLIILLGSFDVIPEDYYKRNHLTFWAETVAVEAFGVSWLLRGLEKN